jgi:hypothetical protein
MNWYILLFAACFAVPAIFLLFVHPIRKARLFAAILMGMAFLAVLAAIPSLRMYLVHLTASGPGLVILGGGALGALVWCILEFLLRQHKVAAFGRKGEGHQLRPAIAVMTLVLFGVLAIANLPALMHGVGAGASSTFSTVGQR